MASSVSMLKKSDMINIVEDEKFVQIFTSDENTVKLSADKRSVENIYMGKPAGALGVHSYSSGIHRIRTRINKSLPFLGIRSKNIPPEPRLYSAGSYIHSDATYGWVNYFRYHNGLHSTTPWDCRFNRVGHIWTITLNCDEHRLHLLDETTNEEDDIVVDVDKAPFPWCLFVGLHRATAGILLI
ncbi:unnamed protein product [Adineta ricciae]|uniref:Uncharacterized protein n=1 Tax=Adineta ricciae TaxID=249248 RepID=A0A815TJM2_ADIRI|nr:unnamed protein product [Adineta ricciae]CAF1615579.1 unnamed protein product [Adineta ricciae]